MTINPSHIMDQSTANVDILCLPPDRKLEAGMAHREQESSLRIEAAITHLLRTRDDFFFPRTFSCLILLIFLAWFIGASDANWRELNLLWAFDVHGSHFQFRCPSRLYVTLLSSPPAKHRFNIDRTWKHIFEIPPKFSFNNPVKNNVEMSKASLKLP